MRDLSKWYKELLEDKRIRGEQNKYEAFSRQRNSVLSKYKKVWQAYRDLQAGLSRAEQFYNDMKDTVESLKKNVDSFVANRKSEGAQLLKSIEATKGSGADLEQNRLKELMERMSITPANAQSNSSPMPGYGDQRSSSHRPPPLQAQASYAQQQQQPLYNPAASPPITPRYPPANGMQSPAPYPSYQQQQQQQPSASSYNPNNYGAMSPPAHQQYFNPPPNQQYNNYQQASTTQYGQQPQQSYGGQTVPQGWQPPPPPPGPPPSQDYSAMQASQYPSGAGGYAHDPRRSGQPTQTNGADPWAGLNQWK